MNPGKIFFSYSRTDSEFALKLGKDLREKGANIWFDQLDITPGSTWDLEVENALNSSDCLLVLLSPDSVASKNVMDEINYGIEEKKKVIPVLIRNCKIPFRLRRLQFIDFSKNYDQGLNRLVKTLNPETGAAESAVSEKKGGLEKTKNFISRNKYAVITAGLLLLVFFTWVIIRPGNNKKTTNINNTNDSLRLLTEQQRKDSLQIEQELKDSINRELQAWDTAVIQNTIESYKEYQRNFSQGIHYQNAQEEIIKLTAGIEAKKDEKDWSKAIKINTIAALEFYKSQHPGGIHFSDAIVHISKLKKIEADEKAWANAIRQGTIQSFQQYLTDYPRGMHNAEATNKKLELLQSRLTIGKQHQGGIIIKINPDGKHGLLVAKEDLSDAANMHTISKSIDSYRPEDSRNWRLPTKEELNLIFDNRHLLTGFIEKYYWSDTKSGSTNKYWVQHFGDGKVNIFNINDLEYAVRLVRDF